MPPSTGLDELVLKRGYLNAAAVNKRMGIGTIGTTGVVVVSMIAEFACVLNAVSFVTNDLLAANDTNYVTLSVVNWQKTAASVAMLAATAPNTTQATGGLPFTAKIPRALTLNATPANLAVAAGDTIAFLATVTGTLGSAITGGSFLATFTPS